LKKNYKVALITFIGGLGVVPLLLSIFSENLEFGQAIVIAFAFFLVTGVLNGLLVVTPSEPGPLVLDKSQKEAVITLVGGMGVLAVLIGIFMASLSFGYTIVIAYSFFLIAGTLSTLIDERSKSEDLKHYSPPENIEKVVNKKKLYDLNIGTQCSSCGSHLEDESIFCTQCGAKYVSS
jgi:hypothetical protein